MTTITDRLARAPRFDEALPSRRQRVVRWLLTVMAVAVAGMVFVAAFLAGQSESFIDTAKLDDGTTLRLVSITEGTQHKYVFQRQKLGFLPIALPGGNEFCAFVEMGESFPGYGVWLTARNENSSDPLDLSNIGSVTIVDADGWEHRALMIGRAPWTGSIAGVMSPHTQHLGHGPPPFAPLPAGAHQEVVVGAVFPRFGHDGRFPVRVYDSRHTLLTELSGRADAVDAEPLVPESLPATQTVGDLQVRLRELRSEVIPAGADRSSVALRLRPQVDFIWRGRATDDWQFHDGRILAIEDEFGNLSLMNECTLSPRRPAWKVGLLLTRKPFAHYDDDEFHNAGTFAVPGRDESVKLDLQGTIGGIEYRVLRLLGAGKHAFPINNSAISGSISPPLHQADDDWLVKVMHSPGRADWVIDSERPAVVVQFEQSADSRKYGVLRVVESGRGSPRNPDGVYDYYFGPTMTSVLFLDPGDDSGEVTLLPTADEFRHVQFTVPPPSVPAHAGQSR